MQPLAINAADFTSWVGDALWPFFRIAGMFSIAPVIGSTLIPVRIRVSTAVLVSVIAAPAVNVPDIDLLSASAVLVTVNQVLVGIAMGFVVQMVFASTVIAGEQIAMSMGLGFAQMTDPQNGVSVPVVSQFLVVTVTLLFLALDGHLALIQMIVSSFELLPVGVVGLDADGLWLLLNWAAQMFKAAVMIALPAVTSLLAVNLALGVMTRAAPQLNVFSVGFPITIVVGLLALFWSLPTLTHIFDRALDSAFGALPRLLAGA